jgi:parallel beta-helix repeat protein
VYIGTNSSAIFRHNRVFGNNASYGGGGLSIWDGGNPTISRNIIISNTVDNEGGGLAVYFSDAKVEENTIISNTANGWAGGLFIGVGDPGLSGEPIFSGNLISGNRGDGSGGGLVLDYSNASLINNIIVGNRTSGDGAGIRISDSTPRLVHNTIARNLGGNGHGIYIDSDESGSCTVAITNTILVSQTVGVYATLNTSVRLQATLWGGGNWANGTDWKGAGTIITGTINLWGDPGFVDPDVGDYHIGSGSAALDQGIDEGVTRDIDLELRPYQAPDLGADEYWPPGSLMYTYLPLITK